MDPDFIVTHLEYFSYILLTRVFKRSLSSYYLYEFLPEEAGCIYTIYRSRHGFIGKSPMYDNWRPTGDDCSALREDLRARLTPIFVSSSGGFSIVSTKLNSYHLSDGARLAVGELNDLAEEYFLLSGERL